MVDDAQNSTTICFESYGQVTNNATGQLGEQDKLQIMMLKFQHWFANVYQYNPSNRQIQLDVIKFCSFGKLKIHWCQILTPICIWHLQIYFTMTINQDFHTCGLYFCNE